MKRKADAPDLCDDTNQPKVQTQHVIIAVELTIPEKKLDFRVTRKPKDWGRIRSSVALRGPSGRKRNHSCSTIYGATMTFHGSLHTMDELHCNASDWFRKVTARMPTRDMTAYSFGIWWTIAPAHSSSKKRPTHRKSPSRLLPRAQNRNTSFFLSLGKDA